MGLDKKVNYNLSLNLYCENIVKIALIWSYFKFISIGFKQNLGLGCSKFYFKGQNNFLFLFLILYIIFFGAKPGVHLNPLGWL